jgi:RNA polymerase sigma factor (sigma-70 family)
LEKPSPNIDVSTSNQHREDILLWESLRRGNDLAFSSLYKKYIQSLFNYGMHIHPDRDLIMDCLQELFAEIWDKREKLGQVERVGFYLFRSFKNLLIRKIESYSKKSTLSQESWNQLVIEPSFEFSWICSEQAEERLVRLKKAVSMLTPRQREIVLLKFFQGLEAKEIGEIMNLSIAGVHNLISLTVKSLRDKMNWCELTVIFLIAEFIFF